MKEKRSDCKSFTFLTARSSKTTVAFKPVFTGFNATVQSSSIGSIEFNDDELTDAYPEADLTIKFKDFYCFLDPGTPHRLRGAAHKKAVEVANVAFEARAAAEASSNDDAVMIHYPSLLTHSIQSSSDPVSSLLTDDSVGPMLELAVFYNVDWLKERCYQHIRKIKMSDVIGPLNLFLQKFNFKKLYKDVKSSEVEIWTLDNEKWNKVITELQALQLRKAFSKFDHWSIFR